LLKEEASAVFLLSRKIVYRLAEIGVHLPTKVLEK
jgi:hypothetical protein